MTSDLERLAAGYDHRPPSTASLDRAARAARRAGLGRGHLAVDVGGGRGHHARRFAATGADVVVVDRSAAMGRHAAAGGLPAVVGDAARLPVASGVARLVWSHAAVHHGDWRAWLEEAVRIAGPGGLVSVWTFRPEHARSSFLTRWFPTVGEVDAGRFPDPGDLAETLAELGCREVRIVDEDEIVVRRAGDWVRGVRGGFVSTLQAVPADELAAGLERFRSEHPDDDERLRYLLRYAGVSGRTPSLR